MALIEQTEENFDRCAFAWKHHGIDCGRGAYDVIRPYVKDVHCVIDVGANMGGFTEAVLTEFPDASAYVFEPARPFSTLCKEHLIRFHNVHVFKKALGDQAGAAKIYKDVHNPGGNVMHPNIVDTVPHYAGGWFASIEEVEVAVFDELNIDAKIDLVKIDVEGFEYAVLSGMMRSLAKHKPLVLCELGFGRLLHPEWAKEAEAVNKVVGLGYDMFLLPEPPEQIARLLTIDDPAFDKQREVVFLPR